MDEIWDHVRMITDWLDRESTPTADALVLRVFKVAEEVGEVAQAVIGVTGQNPRKGITHTWDDVQTELCDVILSAMVALQSIAHADAPDVFGFHVAARHARALKTPGVQ